MEKNKTGRMLVDAVQLTRVGAPCACSDLLEEGEEPFEVLPGAQVGPCLYAALKVLCASDAAFSSWSTIAGAWDNPPLCACVCYMRGIVHAQPKTDHPLSMQPDSLYGNHSQPHAALLAGRQTGKRCPPRPRQPW